MMPAVAELSEIKTVAVIDDDPENVITTSLQVEEAGFKPLAIEGGFRNLDDFFLRVKKGAQGVVCDHKLRRIGNYAPFNGAEAVARLFDRGIPAVLVSQYRREEAQFMIRTWRRKVPVLLSRDQMDPQTIRTGLRNCVREIRGFVPPERKPHRALVRIDEREGERVTAFVPQWNPVQAVYFLDSLIPPHLQHNLIGGRHFTAMVNIGAQDADELFFEDFALAPEPDPNDGLS